MLTRMQETQKKPIKAFLMSYYEQTKRSTISVQSFIANIYKAFLNGKFGLSTAISTEENGINEEKIKQLIEKSTKSKTPQIQLDNRSQTHCTSSMSNKGSIRHKSYQQPTLCYLSKYKLKKEIIPTATINLNISPSRRTHYLMPAYSEEEEVKKCTFTPYLYSHHTRQRSAHQEGRASCSINGSEAHNQTININSSINNKQRNDIKVPVTRQLIYSHHQKQHSCNGIPNTLQAKIEKREGQEMLYKNNTNRNSYARKYNQKRLQNATQVSNIITDGIHSSRTH